MNTSYPPQPKQVNGPSSELLAQLLTLFNVVHATEKPSEFIRVFVGRGNATEKRIHARAPIETLPTWVATDLTTQPGRRQPEDIRVHVATYRGASDEPASLGAAFTEVALPPVFVSNRRHQGWQVAPEVQAAAWAALDGFVVPPTIVIHQAWSLLALWPLSNPLSLRGKGLARAERLQQALAVAVGGRTDSVRLYKTQGVFDTVPAWSLANPALRLPGSVNSDIEDTGAPVTIARFSETRHDLEALEGALVR